MAYSSPTQSRGTIVTSSNSQALSFLATPAVGALIVVVISTYNGALGTSAVTDNQGNTYSRRVVASQSAGADCAVFAAVATTSSGTFTVTVNPDGSSADYTFCIVEFRGNASTPNDNVDFDVQTSASPNTTDVTPSENNCLWVGGVSHAGADMTITETSGTLIYENQGGSSNMPLSATYKIQTTAAAESADWTLGSSATWNAPPSRWVLLQSAQPGRWLWQVRLRLPWTR
jgi:hypothetical protein